MEITRGQPPEKNISKTKLMSNRGLKSAVVVKGEEDQSVNASIYFGQICKNAIQRKMREGCEALFKDKDFSREKKTRVSNGSSSTKMWCKQLSSLYSNLRTKKTATSNRIYFDTALRLRRSPQKWYAIGSGGDEN